MIVCSVTCVKSKKRRFLFVQVANVPREPLTVIASSQQLIITSWEQTVGPSVNMFECVCWDTGSYERRSVDMMKSLGSLFNLISLIFSLLLSPYLWSPWACVLSQLMFLITANKESHWHRLLAQLSHTIQYDNNKICQEAGGVSVRSSGPYRG